MVPGIALSAEYLKKFIKSIPWIALSRYSERHNHWLITPRIRLVMKYRPAQR